jgi:hypothetical protein
MAVVYAAQIQTTLKEIVRRSDSELTRVDLIESAEIELDVARDRIVEQLDTLDRRGEVYHVGDGTDAEVRVP